MIRVLRRADSFAEPEIDEMVDNCSDGLQEYKYITQQGNIGPNHASGDADFPFADEEFTYGIDGENGEGYSEAGGGMFAGMKKRRASRQKMRQAKQASKIRARDAKGQAKIMKADAKQIKAGAKQTAAEAQKEAASSLGKDTGPVIQETSLTEVKSEGMDPKTKKILLYGGIAIAVISIGTLVYFKFIKKKTSK